MNNENTISYYAGLNEQLRKELEKLAAENKSREISYCPMV